MMRFASRAGSSASSAANLCVVAAIQAEKAATRRSKFLLAIRDGLLAPRPTPQAGGPPLVGCPRLLIQFIRSYPPY